MLDYCLCLVIHAQLLQQVINTFIYMFIHFLGIQKEAINRKYKGISPVQRIGWTGPSYLPRQLGKKDISWSITLNSYTAKQCKLKEVHRHSLPHIFNVLTAVITIFYFCICIGSMSLLQWKQNKTHSSFAVES